MSEPMTTDAPLSEGDIKEIERSCRRYRQATVGVEAEHDSCAKDLLRLIALHRALAEQVKRDEEHYQALSAMNEKHRKNWVEASQKLADAQARVTELVATCLEMEQL